MQDPKKTQASIETEEQKLRTKQQSTMNFVMIAAKDLAQAKIDYEKSLQTKSHMVDAKSALDNATENYNLFKEQADEVNKLLKPYDVISALDKQHKLLIDQKLQLNNELADLTSSAKTSGERKGSASKPIEPEIKKTLTQNIVGLVVSKPIEKEKSIRQQKIQEIEDKTKNVIKAIKDIEHQKFLISIQNADPKKLDFDKQILMQEQAKLNKSLQNNPNLVQDIYFKDNLEKTNAKISAITHQQESLAAQSKQEQVKITPKPQIKQ